MNPLNTNIWAKQRELARLGNGIARGFGRRSDLRDQLERALGSVAANFLEGCGRRTEKDRRRFFDIAKGSAYECAGLVDHAEVLGLVEREAHATFLDYVDHLGAMLHKFR
jgi:four helix bundle protein